MPRTDRKATPPGTSPDGAPDLVAAMRRGVVSPAWLSHDHAARLPATPGNVEDLRLLALRLWREKAAQGGRPEPADLSGGCMLAAMLVKAAFGGAIRGNFDHVHNVVDGRIVDLSSGSADVAALAAPYRHDPAFMRERDLHENLATWTYRIVPALGPFLEAARSRSARGEALADADDPGGPSPR